MTAPRHSAHGARRRPARPDRASPHLSRALLCVAVVAAVSAGPCWAASLPVDYDTNTTVTVYGTPVHPDAPGDVLTVTLDVLHFPSLLQDAAVLLLQVGDDAAVNATVNGRSPDSTVLQLPAVQWVLTWNVSQDTVRKKNTLSLFFFLSFSFSLSLSPSHPLSLPSSLCAAAPVPLTFYHPCCDCRTRSLTAW